VVAVVATALMTVETDDNQQKAAAGAAKMAVVVAEKAEWRWLWCVGVWVCGCVLTCPPG
jgi:hypothetical protein